MKIHLPLELSALLCLAITSTSQTLSASTLTDPNPTTEVFANASYVLESDESLVNPSWSGDPESTGNTLSFDGNGQYSLTLEKNASGGTTDFIQIGTNSSRHTGETIVSFDNLQNVSLKNSDGDSSKGSAVTIYHKEGNGSVEFSKITGNVSIEGFRPEAGKSSVLVVGDKGNSSISFSDIGGDISVSNNKATSGMPVGGAALTAWVDVSGTNPYTPYKASVSFSNVTGNINFLDNASKYAGGAINAASFNGQAQVKFSQIQGNTTFSGNSSIQGGAIHIQGFYDSTQEDVSLTYTDSTGNVTFSNNSATSGGAVSVTGINQTIKFSNLKGDVVFQGNSATNSGGAILLGDHKLGAVSPITSYNWPDITRSSYARLEFSNIEGDVSFLNNSVTTTNGGGKGGAIYVGDTYGISPTYVVLSADKGNITFSGNTVNNVANAIHVEGQTPTYLRAQEGYSVNFYDPFTSTTGSPLHKYDNCTVYINAKANNTSYNGRVVFSGARINAETLGGDPATLEARLAASKTSKINGELRVWDGTLEITDGAIVHCKLATLESGSTLEISKGGELKLGFNEATNSTLNVKSGATLMTGDTTLAASGDGSLKTSTGISGGILQIADGAILGTFVHDTGKTNKDAIVASMKEGFGTSSHVNTTYLYQVGKNVELEGTESVKANEILNPTDGGSITISTIESGGQAYVDQGGSISLETIQEGGILAVSNGSAEITSQASSTLGSFNQAGTETTSAQVRLDSASSDKTVINAASTEFQAANNETTTINKQTTLIAKSIEVSSSQPETRTTLVNDGVIQSTVKVSGDGAVVKGSGTFGGGLAVTSGGVVIVGNSPGLQIYSNTVDIAGSKVVFSVDGLNQATQTVNGWGSGTYSNIQMNAGTFHWDVGTTLGLELSSSLSTLSPGTSIDLVLMTFNVGSDSSTSVAEITLGGQTIWNGNLYTELVENPIQIEILKSLEQQEAGPKLIQNVENTKLVSSYDQEKGVVTVSLQGVVSVPEPSTSALGLLGVTLLLLRRKK